MGITSKLVGGLTNPLGAAYNMFDLTYPFVKDQNFPGVAEARHARATNLRDAYLKNRQNFNDAGSQGGPSTMDLVNRGLDWYHGPHGETAQAAPQAAPAAPAAAPAPFGGAFGSNMFAPPTFPQTTAPVPAGLPAAPQAPAPAPQEPTASPMDNAQWPFGPNGAPGAAQAQAPVPMPQPRPAEAPTAPPDMSFFQRNAAMMRDPMTGDFLDPQAGKQADATGPDLIQKFMNYFHNKA